jgi:hypothetical protein
MNKVADYLKERGGHTFYGLNEFANTESLKKIRAKLEETGTWADMWEEGSVAFSIVSLQDAKKACALVEANILAEEM